MRRYEYGDPAKVAEINEERERRESGCRPCKGWSRLWGVEVYQIREGVAGRKMACCEKFDRKG